MTLNEQAFAEALPRQASQTAPHPSPRQPSGAEARWQRRHMTADAVALTVGSIAAVSGALTLGPGTRFLSGIAFVIVAMVALTATGMYRDRMRVEILDDLRSALGATSVAAMAVITGWVIFGGDAGMGHFAAAAWAAGTTALVTSRVLVSRAHLRSRRAGATARRTLVVGAGHVGRLAASRLLAEPTLGLEPIGFLDKEPLADDGPTAHLPVLGASWDLERVVAEHGVEHVLIGFSTAPHHVLLGLVRRCWQMGIRVSIVPRLFELEGERASSEFLGNLPLVLVHPTDPHDKRLRVKYAIDRFVASLLLVLLAPLLLGIALAVLVTSGRPVLFGQERVGLDGRTFRMLKFRTMRGRPDHDGENDAGWAASALGEAPAPAVAQSDRRTPVGRVLRRFSLDELPQLLNIVQGDMSLIGPRPERARYVRRFQDSVYRYGERHRLKPGLTGWAQISGLRGETSLADRIEWDNHYIENWSPWLDLKIVLRTVHAVLGPEDR